MRVIVALFMLGVVTSSGRVIKKTRTATELKDFANFLKDSVHGKPQKPLSPELEDLQNTWERSGKFEGDILLTEDQQDLLVRDFAGEEDEETLKNGITDTTKLWTGKIVYYSITPGQFTAAQESAIEAAVAELNGLSCVKFRKATASNVNYVSVKGSSTGGCTSYVGMIGKAQTLNLAPNTPGSGCFRKGTIMHEFLHAAGFYHAHSTYNRDDYIRIVWNKIEPGQENAFNKYSSSVVSNFGQGYDYGSVLHYSEYGFSVDGSKTIVPIQSTSETIGQRAKLSQKDINKLKGMYSCA